MLIRRPTGRFVSREVAIIGKKALRGGVVVAVACLALSSCDQLYTTNVFEKIGLGQAELPSASKLASMSVSDIQAQAGSPKFFADLEGDAAKKAAVLGNLKSQWGSADPATAQDAAALYARIQLETTKAGDAVNGVLKAADSLSSTDLSQITSSTVVDFVTSALPASTIASKTEFTATIAALCAANDAYEALGTSIGPSGQASGDVAVSECVQGAVVAAFVDQVPGSTPALKADALWNAIHNNQPIASYTAPSTAAGSPLGNLIDASGLDLSKLGL
jgi:hypothetical protein